MNISKAVKTLLATSLLAAGSALAAQVEAEKSPEKMPIQKIEDLTRPYLHKLADSYVREGHMPHEILDVGLINAYGVKGYRFTFVTGQQASLIGDTFYVRQQKVPESTLQLMQLMRDFRQGKEVKGLRISQKFTKIGDFKYRVITFPNGQRARMSEDGTITYPDIKTSRKTQEIER